MLTFKESHDLMVKFIELKNKFKESNDVNDQTQLLNHQKECIEKFKYLVTMKTNRYKMFNNYEDLNQEGLEALVKAMNTFNPKFGNFFSWAFQYINTRISRSANLHTTIRIPLKIASTLPPFKEAEMPVQIENKNCPDKKLETCQENFAIKETLTLVSDQQKEIITAVYGLDGEKPMSVNKVCKKFNISRSHYFKTVKSALAIMRSHIKL